MAKDSTASAQIPGELIQAGMKASQTAQKIKMLNVMNLASLKLPGSLRARNASTKQRHAWRPMYPRTHQNARLDPTLHSSIILERSYFVFRDGQGEASMSQAAQIITCTIVQLKIITLCCLGPSHFMMLSPGLVAVKAASTTRVFARMQEMQSENVMLKAVWRSMQDQRVGSPIKTREHKKQNVRANRIKKLNSELLTRTTAVFL